MKNVVFPVKLGLLKNNFYKLKAYIYQRDMDIHLFDATYINSYFIDT